VHRDVVPAGAGQEILEELGQLGRVWRGLRAKATGNREIRIRFIGLALSRVIDMLSHQEHRCQLVFRDRKARDRTGRKLNGFVEAQQEREQAS